MTKAKRETQFERVRRASRERRELERSELRRTILDQAAALFLERGYENFSMREIAGRIGYSATTIYRHFDDRDALLFAVVDQGFERFRLMLAEAAASTDDPRTRIKAIGRAYIRFGLENPAYYRLMFLQRSDYLHTTDSGGEAPRGASFDILRQAVQSGIDANFVRASDATAAGNYLWAAVHGIVALAIAGPHRECFATEDEIDRMLDLMFFGLAPR